MYKAIITVAPDHVLKTAFGKAIVSDVQGSESVVMVYVIGSGWIGQRIAARVGIPQILVGREA